MTEFQGYLKKKRYFEGWYFKHVQNGRMLAFIPGIQLDASGRGSAFLQVLTDRGAHQCEYPLSDFHVRRSGLGIKVGESVFTARGAKLSLQTDGLSCTGTLRYGPMTPLHGDIMGPLRFVPFLQCNHGIRSLWHTVDGHVRVNGEDYVFDKGEGYIEKDWEDPSPVLTSGRNAAAWEGGAASRWRRPTSRWGLSTCRDVSPWCRTAGNRSVLPLTAADELCGWIRTVSCCGRARTICQSAWKKAARDMRCAPPRAGRCRVQCGNVRFARHGSAFTAMRN